LTLASKIENLLQNSIDNTIWRQQECINLIPSEQTPSALVRLLSVMDPVCRYAEHRRIKELDNEDVFYYQGTDFIREVEYALEEELRRFLGCREVETRLVSGQMANAGFFSAMVDYLNRNDRKSEQRRMRYVMNNHIIKGGHLSSQPMGALRDFVARDPKTGKPAVVNFPVQQDNPYRIELSACPALLEKYQPELIIFGKSMVLHPEPVAQIRAMVDELALDTVIMYDMAHVLGLVGPHFQEPFQDGVDVVTGSTHKTYFGTQRGIISSSFDERHEKHALWEAVRRRAFPGCVSNHHLGTLLGMLAAAYEMNAFKDEYQPRVLKNAKAFALALQELGMDVQGDPAVQFTETHQVMLKVGHGKGIEIAQRLEENNIIANYQATPGEKGFAEADAIRMGTQEMTRFGMQEKDFQTLAQYIHDATVEGKSVKDEVKSFRQQFLELQYCFTGKDTDDVMEKLHQLL
jgi:glycine/serine hydroxymethyltransferase